MVEVCRSLHHPEGKGVLFRHPEGKGAQLTSAKEDQGKKGRKRSSVDREGRSHKRYKY